ncbi:MAG: 3-methyladenine glycosylase [Alphaproteobacteria bacterium]|jgi:DNA-3-methyladenine glycosylase|nr:3-methyladenine glycosylase [Alphaproteobacteria bacterium]
MVHEVTMRRLDRSFFLRPTVQVAQDLLGKRLVFQNLSGVITETEAYHQDNDPACHAYRGKTPRNTPMFGPAGHSYVYFIYGMYYCLNIVTEPESIGAAVLIRGLKTETTLLNGPGKLCRHLMITKAHNAIDLITSDDFYVCDEGLTPHFIATPRIGIRHGTDKLWRFVTQS